MTDINIDISKKFEDKLKEEYKGTGIKPDFVTIYDTNIMVPYAYIRANPKGYVDDFLDDFFDLYDASIGNVISEYEKDGKQAEFVIIDGIEVPVPVLYSDENIKKQIPDLEKGAYTNAKRLLILEECIERYKKSIVLTADINEKSDNHRLVKVGVDNFCDLQAEALRNKKEKTNDEKIALKLYDLKEKTNDPEAKIGKMSSVFGVTRKAAIWLAVVGTLASVPSFARKKDGNKDGDDKKDEPITVVTTKGFVGPPEYKKDDGKGQLSKEVLEARNKQMVSHLMKVEGGYGTKLDDIKAAKLKIKEFEKLGKKADAHTLKIAKANPIDQETNWGITKAIFKHFKKNFPEQSKGMASNLIDLKEKDAVLITQRIFIEPNKINQLEDAGLARMILDVVYNHSTKTRNNLVNGAIQSVLKKDQEMPTSWAGKMQFLNDLNARDTDKVINKIHEGRIELANKQKKYKDGLLNRYNETFEMCQEMRNEFNGRGTNFYAFLDVMSNNQPS